MPGLNRGRTAYRSGSHSRRGLWELQPQYKIGQRPAERLAARPATTTGLAGGLRAGPYERRVASQCPVNGVHMVLSVVNFRFLVPLL